MVSRIHEGRRSGQILRGIDYGRRGAYRYRVTDSFGRVDLEYCTDLRELNEQNFARTGLHQVRTEIHQARTDLRSESAAVRDRALEVEDRGGADRTLLALTAEDTLGSGKLVWAPSLRLNREKEEDGAGSSSDAAQDFRGPSAPLLSPWEQLALVLLQTNELVFID